MKTETNIIHGGPKPYSNPYLAGVMIGLVLLASFLILDTGLDASCSLARIGAWLSMCILAPHTLGSEYFGKWGTRPLNYYLVLMFVGTFVGALCSALLANRAHLQVERGTASSVSRRLAYALAGGVIVGFASRLTHGCTSGQALSSGVLFLPGSLAFLVCLFASGYATSWLVRRQWHD
jgi:uncharacterized membrane protein YedE/YeeE